MEPQRAAIPDGDDLGLIGRRAKAVRR
jgi:hypothetical protein